MENKNVSKKIPIAFGVAWIAFIILSYLAAMVYTVMEPQGYVRMIGEGWPVILLGTITCGISAVFMAVIMILARKAEIKWLKIVSRIHLLLDLGFTVLFGILLLTYL